MAGPVSVAPWGSSPATAAEASAFTRLWRGFANARIAVAGVLLLLLAALFSGQPGGPHQGWLLGVGVLYLVEAVALRALCPPLGRQVGPAWLLVIGIDLAVIATLEWLQAGGVNYTPLLAVPVLMASVLGSSHLAFGTTAAVALLMLAEASLRALQLPADGTPLFLQAGLTGLGYFALALLAHQLAGRLAREEQSARRSQDAARLQSQVNELVIDTLADGVLVVDAQGWVRASNPTACALLGRDSGAAGFLLSEREGWLPLLDLAERTIAFQVDQLGEVAIACEGDAGRRLLVRTRVAGHDADAGQLCVLFLEDLRETEARVRTEKLAAMGRMSAAVAHEIRNPLAAIAQANALLDEELTDGSQRQLTALIQQNAQRLARIVEDVLNVARVQQQGTAHATALPIDATVAGICQDWLRQSGNGARVRVSLQAGESLAAFEPDHLRRVLVNLLENAARYAGCAPDAIQVASTVAGQQLTLAVWSDGLPLEPAVRQHLFEPFFSSESRSSGLGLYICRELCERNGARIAYARGPAPLGDGREGNSFSIQLPPAARPLAGAPAAARIQA